MANSESGKINASSNFVTVTPNDSTETIGIRGLYVSVGGTLSLVNRKDETVDFGTVVVGTVIPVQPKIIRATGTTATVIGLK